MRSVYQLHGVHCASCVNKIETALRDVSGVTKVSVNFATETATVDGEVSPEALAAAIARVGGYTLERME